MYQRSEELLFADDYDVLRDARLTLEQMEGVFVNPPPTTPKYVHRKKIRERIGLLINSIVFDSELWW